MKDYGAFQFQSTLPARGATDAYSVRLLIKRISIHAPRTGSDPTPAPVPDTTQISIHAPRTGSDGRASTSTRFASRFQSTLPARGATFALMVCNTGLSKFQSTLPARGATVDGKKIRDWRGKYFNPRSPHGERRAQEALNAYGITISIHAPRTGSDGNRDALLLPAGRAFQSTLPARGATWQRMIRRNIKMAFQSTLPARGATFSRGRG